MKAVVFDTNAYLDLAEGLSEQEVIERAAEICDLEKNCGVTAYAHHIVIWEMLAHLSDGSNHASTRWLKSLIFLGVHSQSRNPQISGISLIADMHLQICESLFGTQPCDYKEGVHNISKIVSHIVKYGSEFDSPKTKQSDIVSQNITKLSEVMSEMETKWVKGMNGVLDQFAPGTGNLIFGGTTDTAQLKKIRQYLSSEEYYEAWSNLIVANSAALVGIKLDSAELKTKGEFIRENFRVPFQLWVALLHKLATPCPAVLENEKKKRWNYIWDSMISFVVGPGEVEEAEIALVSGDREIANAAIDAGHSNNVISLETYLNMIGYKKI